MPVLKDFGGFQIMMYFRDHNPPHVHVENNDFRALVSIEDALVFEGNIDAKFRRDALDWVAEHRLELLKKWAEYQK